MTVERDRLDELSCFVCCYLWKHVFQLAIDVEDHLVQSVVQDMHYDIADDEGYKKFPWHRCARLPETELTEAASANGEGARHKRRRRRPT